MNDWTLYTDDYLLYSPGLERYKVFSPKFEPDVDKVDKLTFTVYPDHPNYSRLVKLASTITLYYGSDVKFRGRILNDKLGWNNEKTVTCEGELAFLNDSVQRPFSFPMDEEHTGPADYFAFLIGRHNEQVEADRRFFVGNVTVTDPNNYIARSDTEYSSTWTLVKQGLLGTLGGYISFRHEENGVYIDYLADFPLLANQQVEFGLNMLSLSTERKGEDIVSAILPLGASAEESGERLTISQLEDVETSDICKTGDYVYSKDAVAQYGFIIKTMVWDDVTVASNLLAKAAAALAQKRMIASTVTLTAADLAAAGYDVNTFSVGTYVNVVDDKHEAHDLLARYLVKKLSINWLNPAQNKLTLGATTYSLTERTQQQTTDAMTKVEGNVKAETARTVHEVEQRNTSAIEQSSEMIRSEVTESYYTKGETDQRIGEVSTKIEQTATGINIQFEEMKQDIKDVEAGADAEFNERKSYIQFVNGEIILGKVNESEIKMRISNDRIGIYSNDVLITYWTTQDFVAPKTVNVPLGGRLILGDFAFIPRSNGSLDFTWIGA